MSKTLRFRNVITTQWTKPVFKDYKGITFVTGQKEICPDTKKEHWHLYVEFEEKKSIKAIKEFFGDETMHIEGRKGTQAQAIEYVTKKESKADDETILYGTKKQSGTRTDLDSMVDMIEEGHTCKEILMEHRGNALRHIGMIQKGLIVFHDCCPIDAMIRGNRWAQSNEPLESDDSGESLRQCPEVGGNTNTHLGHPKKLTKATFDLINKSTPI